MGSWSAGLGSSQRPGPRLCATATSRRRSWRRQSSTHAGIDILPPLRGHWCARTLVNDRKMGGVYCARRKNHGLIRAWSRRWRETGDQGGSMSMSSRGRGDREVSRCGGEALLCFALGRDGQLLEKRRDIGSGMEVREPTRRVGRGGQWRVPAKLKSAHPQPWMQPRSMFIRPRGVDENLQR